MPAAGGNDEPFLGTIGDRAATYSPWKVTLQLNSDPIEFKIDTGADVTVIPKCLYNPSVHGPLQPSAKDLSGPCYYELHVEGRFTGEFKLHDKEVKEEVYVVQKLRSLF